MLAKPVYITVPTDIAYAKISARPLRVRLDTTWPVNDPEMELDAVNQIISMIHNSKKPIVLADAGAIRFRVRLTDVVYTNLCSLEKSLI